MDKWNLPGGVLKYGETPWEGVIREVLEETGLKVEVTRLTGVYSKPDKNEIVFAFLCNVIGGKIRTNEEADRIEYFSQINFPENLIPKQRDRILDSLKELKEAALKTQLTDILP